MNSVQDKRPTNPALNRSYELYPTPNIQKDFYFENILSTCTNITNPSLLNVKLDGFCPLPSSPNRFNKERLPTAFHSWVATQSHKGHDEYRGNPFDVDPGAQTLS